MANEAKGVLDRQFVRVRADKPCGRELFGVFLGGVEDDHGAGRVYDFSTKRFFLVGKANCRVVEPYDVTGGLKDLAVRVSDWGVGVVVEEWLSGGTYHARVRDGADRSTTASIGMITVQVPGS